MRKLPSHLAIGLSLSSFLFTSLSQAACFVRGEAGIRNTNTPILNFDNFASLVLPDELWTETERKIFLGSQLASQLGQIEGDDIVYRGRASAGFLLYGPYESLDGNPSVIKSSILLSMNWTPDGEEYCTGKKSKGLFQGSTCKGKAWRTFPTSFMVEISTHAGTQVHYQKRFENVHHLDHAFIDLPELECDGAIENFEARIQGLEGGEGTIVVHELVVDKLWKN